ncbi:MAG TPA: hypothetical protein VFO18_14575 [Methylomirabilota bacterium]|nr:hypothetical protein [Methylomirabilota bacterium]
MRTMPDLDFALLANAAQVGGDRLISLLGGGWDTAAVPQEAYPVGMVLNVVFRLRFDDEEVGKTHAGEIAVEGEDGERIAVVTFSLDVQRAQELPPGWKTSVPVVAPVPVQFPGPGLYALLIAVGGAVLKTIALRMKVAGA